MLLCLVYHKVVINPERGAYRVAAQTLEKHIEILRRYEITLIKPNSLSVSDNEPKVHAMLTFDDATADHGEIVDDILCDNGISAVFFVPTGKLGSVGRLNCHDVRRLADHGHVIGSHGHTHQRLDRMSSKDVAWELQTASTIIAECVGERPTFFAPPGGYSSTVVRTLAYEAGIRHIRTMQWGYNHDLSSGDLKVLPMDNAFSRHFLTWGIHEQHERLLSILYNCKERMKQCFSHQLYDAFKSRLSGFNKQTAH
jgi:peptidoglycan/xylan/chitin deacetylase (PgdA/CDA1 family)